MRKIFSLLLFVLFVLNIDDVFGLATSKCLNISYEKANNDVSVVFIDCEKNKDLLILFCISSGSADEIEHRGISNLLTKIFAKRLRENTKTLGVECNSYVGFDQNVYYFFGKAENLEDYLKSFGNVMQTFSATEKEAEEFKKNIEQNINQNNQSDKKSLRSAARKSLYFHSQYGFDIEGNAESIKKISFNDVNNFKNNHYVNSQLTIVIVGNPKKKNVLEAVRKYFPKSDRVFKRVRLQEPPHHGSTVKLVKKSSQIGIPIIEMYWRIPNYSENPEKALACDMFVNTIDKMLSKKLIEELGLAASISFCYSFWNREYGDFCLTVMPKDSPKIKLLETALISEIKYIANKGISAKAAEEASKKLSNSANYLQKDSVDIADIFSKKLSSGYDFKFVKDFSSFSKKYEIEKVNKHIKEFFCKNPCVISKLMPATENGKNKNEL